MFCCIFLTNILQNRRKRISAKLLDDGTRHGHTLSQPAHIVGQPSARQRNRGHSKCFRCCIAKKEERKAGGGGGGGLGTGLRAPLKPIQGLWCFFACVVVVVVFYGLGGC